MGNLEVLNSQLTHKHEHLKGEYDKLIDLLKSMEHTHSQPSVEIVQKKRDAKKKNKTLIESGANAKKTKQAKSA